MKQLFFFLPDEVRKRLKFLAGYAFITQLIFTDVQTHTLNIKQLSQKQNQDEINWEMNPVRKI